MSLPLTD